MKNCHIYYSIFILSLFLSCNNRDRNEHIDFAHSLNVLDHLDTMRIDFSLLESNGLVSNDQFLFSLNHKSNPIVRVYNHKTGEFRGGFGLRGGGPGEFERVNLSGFTTYGNQIVVSSNNRVRSYDIVDEETGVIPVLTLEGKTPADYTPFNYAFFLNDSTVAGKTMDALYEFSTYDIWNGHKGGLGEYPDFVPGIPNTAKHHLYQSQSRIKPDRLKVASVFSNFPLLRIMDVETMRYKEVFIKSEHNQKSVKVASKGYSVDSFALIKYFDRIAVNENYIVAYYLEYEIVEKNRGSNEWTRNNLTAPYFYVFDWDGTPIVKLKIENWMTKFTITPDNRIITFHPEKKDELYVIDLNKLIDRLIREN